MSFPRLFKKRSKKSFSEPTVKDPSPPLPSHPIIPLRSESLATPQTAPSPPASVSSVSQVHSTDHQVSLSAQTRDIVVAGSDSRTRVDVPRNGEGNGNAGHDVSSESGTRDVAQPAQPKLLSVDTTMSFVGESISCFIAF